VLAQVGLLLPDDSDAIRTAYFQKMFPQASAQFRDERELEAFPDLNVIRFHRYDALGLFGDKIPGLAGLRDHRGFAYAMSRGRGARTYLLAGRDTEAIIDLIEKLAGVRVGVVDFLPCAHHTARKTDIPCRSDTIATWNDDRTVGGGNPPTAASPKPSRVVQGRRYADHSTGRVVACSLCGQASQSANRRSHPASSRSARTWRCRAHRCEVCRSSSGIRASR
jgi:hypothetical protein